ncbi:polysaccharide biosynthesis protein [Erwinia typographi]|uniref:Polysaccharide biosynthesis protein n=1 Tax=Erwinia typographi TaxID=371042 RepID=A0A0A3ZAB2_9GAMM|nr:lipopolysaccharide biosynthesis protein [Erwinia typographi]KGT95835.1 polysaccharide biosynthesis protein [Erwinia typographi]
MATENNPNKHRASLASGAIWSLLSNLFSQIITFVIFLVLARLLSPHLYGVLSVAIMVTLFFRTVFYDSIATAIVRKKEPSVEDYNSAFLLCNLIAVPGVIVVYVLADFFERVMGIEGLATVVRGTCIIIVTSGLSRTHEAWLTHNMQFKALAIRSVISITLGGIVGIYFAWKGMGVTALVLQQVVTNVSATVILWITIPWKPSMQYSKQSMKELLSYSKHVALSGFTNFMNQNSDIAFISYFLGSSASGIYFAGKRIVNTVNTVLSFALSRISLPAFSRLRDQLPEFRKRYLNAVFITISATAPAFIGLSYLSYDLTLQLLGIKWIESVPVMQIVSFAGFITSIGYYNNSVMFALDKPNWQAKLTMLYAISNVVAFLIFVKYGIIAVALAFTLRTILLYPISVWCAITLLNITWRQYMAEITKPILGSLLMCVFLWGVDSLLKLESGWLKISVDIILGGAFYLVFTLVFTRKDKLGVFFSMANKLKVKKAA